MTPAARAGQIVVSVILYVGFAAALWKTLLWLKDRANTRGQDAENPASSRQRD